MDNNKKSFSTVDFIDRLHRLREHQLKPDPSHVFWLTGCFFSGATVPHPERPPPKLLLHFSTSLPPFPVHARFHRSTIRCKEMPLIRFDGLILDVMIDAS
ncbi:hypothetical protein LIA77_08042 [Sarocladium implicatum]|nr:hypothetical protein LIA77_08042 [Sarocladium implicatum]